MQESEECIYKMGLMHWATLFSALIKFLSHVFCLITFLKETVGLWDYQARSDSPPLTFENSWVSWIFRGGGAARKSDNLTAICESTG
jgi:hypothetical protein